MNWYTPLVKKAQSVDTLPKYIIERVSDLSYASKLASLEPKKAQGILDTITNQFKEQLNFNYSEISAEASKIILDNPKKAKEIIASLIDEMNIDLEEHQLKEAKNARRNRK